MAKLEIELVPSCNWGVNARSALTREKWDIIRKKCYKLAGNRCEICKSKGVLHCHEIWKYQDNIQKLSGLVALCEKCHGVKHFGRSQIKGRGEECVRHLMKINSWDRIKTQKHIASKTEEWNKRESQEWDIDINYIKEFLNGTERSSEISIQKDFSEDK